MRDRTQRCYFVVTDDGARGRNEDRHCGCDTNADDERAM
jgi:hypothetical protein